MSATPQQLRQGVELLREEPGDGPTVKKHAFYRMRLRMWLSGGDPVRWTEPWGLIESAQIEDEGATLITDLRVDTVEITVLSQKHDAA